MLAKLVQQFHLKIFFSNKYVHTSILNKVNAASKFSVSSSAKLFKDVLGETAPKNDLKACLLAGSLLAKRCRQERVCAVRTWALQCDACPGMTSLSLHRWASCTGTARSLRRR